MASISCDSWRYQQHAWKSKGCEVTDTIATRPAEPRPHADPYAIDATKCAKCGSGECHVQVLAWATFEGGSFVAFEYDEEVIPMRSIAICADCGTERVIDSSGVTEQGGKSR